MDYKKAGDVIWVPLLDIYVDPEFNCRGSFTPQQVHELGQNITKSGQIEPLLIQPIADVPDDERPDPCAWPFRLIAGHRRYMAIDLWTDVDEAKCVVIKGLTRQRAHELNLIENIQRETLNMLQEAKGIVSTWPNDEVKDIAKMAGQPKRWVKARLDLLRLPAYVQKKAAAGILSQYDVEKLAELPPEQVEPVFQELVTTKGTSNKPSGVRGYGWKNRTRGKREIKDMISLLYRTHEWAGMSAEERGLVVSTLSWVMKGIESTEFLENRLDYPDGCVIVDKNDKVTGFQDSEGDEMKF